MTSAIIGEKCQSRFYQVWSSTFRTGVLLFRLKAIINSLKRKNTVFFHPTHSLPLKRYSREPMAVCPFSLMLCCLVNQMNTSSNYTCVAQLPSLPVMHIWWNVGIVQMREPNRSWNIHPYVATGRNNRPDWSKKRKISMTSVRSDLWWFCNSLFWLVSYLPVFLSGVCGTGGADTFTVSWTLGGITI